MYKLIKYNLTGSIFRCRIVLPTVLMGGRKIWSYLRSGRMRTMKPSQEFLSPRHMCCGDVTIKVMWCDVFLRCSEGVVLMGGVFERDVVRSRSSQLLQTGEERGPCLKPFYIWVCSVNNNHMNPSLHVLTIADYMSHKSLMDQLLHTHYSSAH